MMSEGYRLGRGKVAKRTGYHGARKKCRLERGSDFVFGTTGGGQEWY